MKRFILFTCILVCSLIASFAYAGTISGSTSVCVSTSGSTVTYTATGFTTPQYYNWSLTDFIEGAYIVSTGSTPGASIQIFYPATVTNGATGTLKLTTAEGTATLNISVSRAMGSISNIGGYPIIYTDCPSELNGKEFSVTPITNAQSYVWYLPTGATKVSQSANYITLSFSSSFTGGTLRAVGVNGVCGATATASLYITATTQPSKYTPSIDYLSSDELTDPDTRTITSNPVGSLPGSVDVSQAGAANYSIPILVPPGTAGLQPSVSINYNSNAGDGLLGRGWNLSATSVIYRVGKTIYLNGTTDKVNYDDNDKFAIDGNNMILYSGTYGATGAVYYTEMETFSKITHTKGTENYFTVQTKDGRTLVYGTSSNARKTCDKGISAWYLSTVTDSYGNTVTYTYLNNSNYEQCLVSKISYSPSNSINFFYVRKSDKVKFFDTKVVYQYSLDRIKVVAESSVVRNYLFNYTNNDGTKLVEIIEKASDGTKYNSTIVNWGTRTWALQQSTVSSAYNTQTVYGDFNADGKTDYVKYAYSSGSWVWYLYLNSFSSSSSAFTYTATGTMESSFNGFQVGDYNGDGKDDLLESHTETDGTYHYVPIFSTGSTFTSSTSNGFISAGLSYVGDFNGDGITDCIVISGTSVQLYSCTGTDHSAFVQIFTGTYDIPTDCSIYTKKNNMEFDPDGDGRTELLLVNNKGSYIMQVNDTDVTIKTSMYHRWRYEKQDDGTYDQINFIDTLNQLTSPFPRSGNSFRFADFNGDGQTDVLVDNDSIVFFSDDTTYLRPFDLSSATDLSVADMNGDGKTDIITQKSDYSYNIYISQGESFNSPVNLTGTYASGLSRFYDFNGDGINELLGYNGTAYTLFSFTQQGINNQLVSAITNGLNYKTQFTYKPLTDATVYTKGSSCTYPLFDYKGPMYVVSSMINDNGLGGQTTTTYTYQGMRIHRQGKGSLGFTKVIAINSTTGFQVQNTYGYNSTYYFPFISTSKTLQGSTTVALNTYTNTLKAFGNKRIFPYVSKVVSVDYLANVTNTTSYTYDSYGNMLTAVTDQGGAATTSVTNTYTTGGSWCNAKIATSTTTKTASGQTAYSRTVNYTYNTYGQVLTVVTDPGSTSNALTTTYEYSNSYGNLSKVTTSASGLTSRYVSYNFDINGRFVTQTTNMLGQSSSATYNSLGNVLTAIDANSLITTYTYDVFGRPATTKLPDGNTSTASLIWADASAPTNALYYSQASASNANTIKIYYDKLGRKLRSVNTGFDGTSIYTDAVYNTKGQLYQASEPYFSTGTAEWTTYTYDAYGRNTGISAPTGNSTTAYSGLTVTTTNTSASPQQSASKTLNALGQVVSATDAGGTISYTYSSAGQPLQITSPGDLVTTMQYDAFGNQTQLVEPNSGTTNYTYNAFGELLTQTKNSVTTTLTYDNLGRLSTLAETEGTTTYTYDTKTKGVGKIAIISSTTGTSQDYTYDSYSRLSSATEIIDGLSFTESLTYNSGGRVSQLTYPSGFAVNYTYNSYYYLNKISRNDNSALVWQANSMNAYGQLLQATSGNGLVTNTTYNHQLVTSIQTGSVQNLAYVWNLATGNLTSRTDSKHSLTETFSYDVLNRLTGAAITNGASYNFAYADNGNISSTTNAGAYTYSSTQLNALTSVTNTQGIIPTTTQSMGYTSYDKVNRITEGVKNLAITYGVDHERRKSVYTTSGTSVLTKYYAHGNYEKEIGDSTRELHYIMAGSSVVAIYVKKTSATAMYYIHKDHLGSLNVVTNASGNVVQENSFDAWGRRRNPANWTYTSLPTSYLFDRGFTGHEHLDKFDLINMNGRVYDAQVGRFLGPDKVVQLPGFTQSYNRYSYCLNNPLKYVDPTGWYGENSSSGEGESADGMTNAEWIATSSPNPMSLYMYMSQLTPNSKVTEAFAKYCWNNQSTTNPSITIVRVGETISIPYYNFQTGQDEYTEDFKGYIYKVVYNPAQGSRDGLNKTVIGMESLGLANSSKEELLKYAAKADASIKDLKYFKSVKFVGKALVIAGVVITGYEVYNDIFIEGKYYSGAARVIVTASTLGASYIPYVGWGISGAIGISDALWGDKLYEIIETKLGD